MQIEFSKISEPLPSRVEAPKQWLVRVHRGECRRCRRFGPKISGIANSRCSCSASNAISRHSATHQAHPACQHVQHAPHLVQGSRNVGQASTLRDLRRSHTRKDGAGAASATASPSGSARPMPTHSFSGSGAAVDFVLTMSRLWRSHAVSRPRVARHSTPTCRLYIRRRADGRAPMRGQSCASARSACVRGGRSTASPVRDLEHQSYGACRPPSLRTVYRWRNELR